MVIQRRFILSERLFRSVSAKVESESAANSYASILVL